jgi:hypothetical protein
MVVVPEKRDFPSLSSRTAALVPDVLAASIDRHPGIENATSLWGSRFSSCIFLTKSATAQSLHMTRCGIPDTVFVLVGLGVSFSAPWPLMHAVALLKTIFHLSGCTAAVAASAFVVSALLRRFPLL